MQDPMRPWDPASEPTFWINHTSRLLLRRFEEALAPLGYSLPTLSVAVTLEAHGPLLQKELAARAYVAQPSMATLLARMERDGLITRTPHPTDKRASLVALTPEARALVPEARERLREAADRATAGLDVDDRSALMGLLRRVAANATG